jgi:LacI family transcriptional regulator/LacI family repressor for deo operon, udp, cdd, tsx, nupC, and nupG
MISQEVRTRIQALAQSMGYSPNALAQSLQSLLSHSIGLVITTIADPFYADIADGVEEVAQRAGISVFLATSHNDPERELRIIESFERRRVDGVIIASSLIGSDYANRLEQISIPVIMINNQAAGDYDNLYSVAVDDYRGARLVMKHLLDLGHRRIGYIGVQNRPGSNERRMHGYRDSLEEYGVQAQPEWVQMDTSRSREDFAGDVDVGQVLAPVLLNQGVTALFCYCDTVAAGAIIACHKLGYPIPDRISLAGFDDTDVCTVLTPPLTTVRQPRREMGQLAMDILLTAISGEPANDIIFQPSLVVRESTAPPHESFNNQLLPNQTNEVV